MNLLITAPYQRQTDNSSGQGWRECFSSTVAMQLMHLGAVRNDDHYNAIRQRFGDTIHGASHLRAVRSLGLVPTFTDHASWATIEAELRAGRVIGLGWLHHGPVAAPRGGGHWSAGIGLTDSHLFIHDPQGEPDMVRGGFVPGRSGVEVRVTRANFTRRWLDRGPGTGRAFIVRRSEPRQPAAQPPAK